VITRVIGHARRAPQQSALEQLDERQVNRNHQCHVQKEGERHDGQLLWIPETKTEAGKRTLPVPE